MQTTPPSPPLPINYVFLDYENVRKFDPKVIGNRTVSFTLLVGAKQPKLPVELVEALLENSASVQLVRLSSSGKNALDFTLTYYLGRAVQADPRAYFHVISKDKGFDPMIEHLRTREIRAKRHEDFSTLTFAMPPKADQAASAGKIVKQALTPDESFARALAHLKKNINNRPKRKVTLVKHLTAFIGLGATDAKVEALIKRLNNDGHIKIGSDNAVTYQLKAAK
jgi:hypothetical protein